VKYLLDVNALLAWEHGNSPHHAAFHEWAKAVGRDNLWTCALSELDFLRVSMQVFGYNLHQASAALTVLKQNAGGFIEIAPSPRLPVWSSNAAKTSDGYLAQIARENKMRLATFDTGIKDAAAELIGPKRS
jgi:predicted nucleic acid-binding protein